MEHPNDARRYRSPWKCRGQPAILTTMRFLLVLLPLLLVAGTAWSDQISLRPPGSAVELRTYGFGLIPFDGSFTRFQGSMRYDPANTRTCQVMLQIEASSLAMSNETVRDKIMGPEMMDVAQFPDLAFHGTCQGTVVLGDLTMHGQTHPISLDYTRSAGTIIATGRIQRAEWGITGSPMTGGSTIRIRVVLPDPFSAQHT
jgi:polyisoprenoid-binding protein YceI